MRPVKLQTYVRAYQTPKNEVLLDRRLNEHLPGIINEFSEGRPVIVFCRWPIVALFPIILICRSEAKIGKDAKICREIDWQSHIERHGGYCPRCYCLRCIRFSSSVLLLLLFR